MKYGLITLAQPTTLPVPINGTGSVKAHSRILGRDDLDLELTEIVKVAVDYLETETNTTLCPTQYILRMDRFPQYYGTRLYPYDFISSTFKLPRNPVISVDSIGYIDQYGVSQTIAPSVYQLANARWPARVATKQGQLWPFVELFNLQAVDVTFTAGYGNTTLIPPIAKQAIKYLFAHFYENRDESVEFPLQLTRLIRKLKRTGFTQWE